MKYNNISRNWLDTVRSIGYKTEQINTNNVFFIIDPLERCLAITLSNCFRRIILSNIYGNAVCAIKFLGAKHEYSSIYGIKEDISDIIMNFKLVLIRGDLDFNEKRGKIKNLKIGTITAQEIELPSDLQIINPELLLFTITSININLEIEIIIKSNKGYISAEEQQILHLPKTYIPVSANFSPVRQCSYKIKKSNINKKEKYSKIVLNIITNGTIAPRLVLDIAIKILQEQLYTISLYQKIKDNNIYNIHQYLSYDISNLKLPIKTIKCLKINNINYLSDLIIKKESEILQIINMNKKSLTEIKDSLKIMNLSFSMKLNIL